MSNGHNPGRKDRRERKARQAAAQAKIGKPGDSVNCLVRNLPEKIIHCEVGIDATRRIRCESGGGFFCFEFTNGSEMRKMNLTDDAAWLVGKMISEMHPRICGSSNPVWHKVQAMRKGDTIPNSKLSNPEARSA